MRGSKCQHPAVQQAWRPFDSVAMLLAFGRRYPLPRAPRRRGDSRDASRRRRAKFFHHGFEVEAEQEKEGAGVGGLVCG